MKIINKCILEDTIMYRLDEMVAAEKYEYMGQHSLKVEFSNGKNRMFHVSSKEELDIVFESMLRQLGCLPAQEEVKNSVPTKRAKKSIGNKV